MNRELLTLVTKELGNFFKLIYSNSIVPNSIPILWFGDSEAYINSSRKIITVSLNPSNNEFCQSSSSKVYSTQVRFPKYNGDPKTLIEAYNDYFKKNNKPYNAWFEASFRAVLKSFEASHYEGAKNTALHTDIASPYATDPTWTGLNKLEKQFLEPIGSDIWHKLMIIFEPDVILISASKDYEKKIKFNPVQKMWKQINVKAKNPLLYKQFEINGKKTDILFQIQGRKPFLQTKEEEKLKFNEHLYNLL